MNLRTCTIEDVAEACGHRMTTAPLITREACESCADAVTEPDTGAFQCKASVTGIPECESYRAVRELEDIAVQCAAKFKRISDGEMRAELATGTADGFSNALYEQGMGAEFNSEAFMELAGCALGADR